MRDVTRRQALGLAAGALAAIAQAGCATTPSQDGGDDTEKDRSVKGIEALDPSVAAGWDSAYYTPAYASLDEAVLASHEVARTIEAEGMVLLANNGVLPLPEGCAVSLLGRCAEDPLFGGYGAGSVTRVSMPVPPSAIWVTAMVRVKSGACSSASIMALVT